MSAIKHPQGQPMLLVRAEYVALTDNLLCAILLAYFEHWHKTQKWVSRGQRELADDLFGFFSVASIRRATKQLEDMGLLEMRKHPYYKQNQTWQYRLEIEAINSALASIESAKPNVSMRQIVPFNLPNRAIESDKSSLSFNRHTDRDKQIDLQTDPQPEPALESAGEGRDSSIYERNDVVGLLVDFGIHEKVAVMFASADEKRVRALIAEARGKQSPHGWLVWALRQKPNRGKAEPVANDIALGWTILTNAIADEHDRTILQSLVLTGTAGDIVVVPDSGVTEKMLLRYSPILDIQAKKNGVHWSFLGIYTGEYVENET